MDHGHILHITYFYTQQHLIYDLMGTLGVERGVVNATAPTPFNRLSCLSDVSERFANAPLDIFYGCLFPNRSRVEMCFVDTCIFAGTRLMLPRR